MRIDSKYDTKIVGRHLDNLRESEASLIRDLDDLFEIPQTPGGIGGSQPSVECLIACGGMAAKPSIGPIQDQESSTIQRAFRARK